MDSLNILTLLPFGITDILVVVKLIYLLGMLMYLVFAAVVVRQVDVMKDSLQGLLELPVKFVAWGHLLATLCVFILAIFIL